MNLTRSITTALVRPALRARLPSRDFTVVSNNCWGAHIYQQLGQPYQTPFVGLFLAPQCYVTLLSRFRWFLGQPLCFVERSRHEYINAFRAERKQWYPIGCLGNEVELQFLHYASKEDAAEKWHRRVQRVSAEDTRLFFKFCDRDGCTADQLMSFDRAPFPHKVCFVARSSPHLRSAVLIPGIKEGQVPDGQTLSRISPRHFDAAGWISGTDGRPRWWRLLRVL